jgi:hypothetical protein
VQRRSTGSDLYLYGHTSEDNAMGFIQTIARICVGFILFSVGIVAALSFARLEFGGSPGEIAAELTVKILMLIIGIVGFRMLTLPLRRKTEARPGN